MKAFLFFLTVCFYSTSCFALAISEAGNQPLAKENYTDWPNLVDAVNDETRVLMTWVNGSESLYYTGKTADANRVLKEFAETKAPELQLILLPGPGPTRKIDDASVTIDYEVDIIGGVARASLSRTDMAVVYDLRPTMKIYLSDNIDIEKLVIPRNVVVSQLQDLEIRYRNAETNKDPAVRKAAGRFMEHLTKSFARTGDEYKKLEQQIEQIKQIVEVHQAEE
ncbi:hypothetical protein [Thalassoglobus polymorphus]|uniref:Uncharacterized protein n=1 Tax=Thalassoglobus polymorphus TaxID=2527994 RepID=A0A517QKL3_9PLAN|nr:hypothetical protein [Thalassoglobus polymorphus]QDT32179.1 hypothetical protein Mal48_14210 [Thalassoglobus polymorphus]